jgi:hypothetical protein
MRRWLLPDDSTGQGPGARNIKNLSWVQAHLPAGRQESKKCDKQLTHIVRVSTSSNFKYVKQEGICHASFHSEIVDKLSTWQSFNKRLS